jgi:hypothetical protein
LRSRSKYNPRQCYCLLDSSTALQRVTSMVFNRVNKRSSVISRTVSFLLVVFILYGTTVEAAHRHGRTLRPANSSTSQVNKRTPDSSSLGQIGCNDCLICQLHQNFSATLIVVRETGRLLSIRTYVSSAVSQSVQSHTKTPSAGRSPPLSFL